MPRRLNKRAYAASIKNAVLEESLIDAIALSKGYAFNLMNFLTLTKI
jgi:hypothetical protein